MFKNATVHGFEIEHVGFFLDDLHDAEKLTKSESGQLASGTTLMNYFHQVTQCTFKIYIQPYKGTNVNKPVPSVFGLIPVFCVSV